MAEIVIILDELDFTWTKTELKKAAELWEAGHSISTITEEIRPEKHIPGSRRKAYETRADEVAILLIHLAREGIIQKRKGGVFGWLTI